MLLVYLTLVLLLGLLLSGLALALLARRRAADRGKLSHDRRDSAGPAAKQPYKSRAEVAIASYLRRHNVKFEYERPYKFDRRYNPDFYLSEQDAYIEHFGIGKDGNTAPFVSDRKYWADIRWKRRAHARHGTRLYETYHWQYQDGILEDALRHILEELGVEIRRGQV